MTIAELFINIGVKGADVSAKALSGVKEGVGEVASSSLAAKAAIIGVVYGLEQLMAHSAQQGMALQQFANFTGLSTERLQRWQYAARQSGVSAEEMAGSFKGVQSAMTDMATGKGAPSGMGILARAVGFDSSKARDTFYVMEKLKEFAKIAPPDLGNSVLKSFGLSEATIQFLRTTKVDLDKIKPSSIYDTTEIERLAKINVAWSNLWNRFEMVIGHLNAQHGGVLIGALGKSLESLVGVVERLIRVSEKFPNLAKAVLLVSVAFAAWMSPVVAASAAIAGLVYLLQEFEKFQEGKKGLFTFLAAPWMGSPLDNGKQEKGSQTTPEKTGQGLLDQLKSGWNLKDMLHPSLGPFAPSLGGSKTTTFNTTVHNQGVTGAGEADHNVGKAVNHAYRQMSGQVQVGG